MPWPSCPGPSEALPLGVCWSCCTSLSHLSHDMTGDDKYKGSMYGTGTLSVPPPLYYINEMKLVPPPGPSPGPWLGTPTHKAAMRASGQLTLRRV